MPFMEQDADGLCYFLETKLVKWVWKLVSTPGLSGKTASEGIARGGTYT